MGLVLCLCFTACTRTSTTQPNFLILAVDNLTPQNIHCTQDNNHTGWQQLCDESVRFTHMYGHSPASLSSLASLLTGTSPWTHGLFHHGNLSLKKDVPTLAQISSSVDRTKFFISQGLPLMKSYELQKGFDYFDDGLEKNNSNFFYSSLSSIAKQTVHFFEDGKPFLGFVYLTQLGIHPGFDLAFEEFDDFLSGLINSMKENGIWNNTYLIVVGTSHKPMLIQKEALQGLKNSSTLFHLLIKPRRLDQDKATSWNVDKYLTLSDLGATLINLIEGPAPMSHSSLNGRSTAIFPDLLQNLPQGPESSKRINLINSWSYWTRTGPVAYAIREESVLNQLSPSGETIKIYNSLIDRSEGAPFREVSLNDSDLKKDFAALKSAPLQPEVDLSADTNFNPEFLTYLSIFNQNKDQLEDYLDLRKKIRSSYQKRGLPNSLKPLLESIEYLVLRENKQALPLDEVQSAWAKRYLVYEKTAGPDACIRLVVERSLGESKPAAGNCDIEFFNQALEFRKNRQLTSLSAKRLVQNIRTHLIKRKIYEKNLTLGFNWNTPLYLETDEVDWSLVFLKNHKWMQMLVREAGVN